jgi:hypothetical protein
MSVPTHALLPALLAAIGPSLVLMATLWVFWPHMTPPNNAAYRQRPPQPTIQQAPQSDPNFAAYIQFWLEEQASAYAKQLKIATGENRRALEALLDQSLAEIAEIRAKQAKQVAPSPNHQPGSMISVQTPEG